MTVKTRRIAGVDIFIETQESIQTLGKNLETLAMEKEMHLKMISSRGVVVYPVRMGISPDVADVIRCRFMTQSSQEDLSDTKLMALLNALAQNHRWTHIEKLHEFDGAPGYSKAHGEE